MPFKIPEGQQHNKVSISPYNDFEFDSEVISELKRLGLSEQLVAEIIRNPMRTELDDEGRVVSIQRDHTTGATVFIHHRRHVEGDPTPGEVRPLNSTVQRVRLEGAPRLG